MKNTLIFLGVLCVLAPMAASNKLQVFTSWNVGYTHYQAQDLNRVMQLFAKRASDSAAGFNRFEVDQFNGHPYQSFVLGVRRGPWEIGLTADWWVESFKQNQVPFYNGRERDARIQPGAPLSCAFLSSGFVPVDNATTGCIQAEERFQFVPLTLSLAYAWQIGQLPLSLKPRYELGVLAGSASLDVATDYFAGYGPDDRLQATLWPGVNLVQKMGLDMEWQFAKRMSLEWKLGWRFSQFAGVELRDVQGKSYIMQLAFNREFINGDRFYIERFRGLGSEEDEFSITQPKDFSKDASYYQSVGGDFDGWNTSLGLKFLFF